jgi:hypothetical protein
MRMTQKALIFGTTILPLRNSFGMVSPRFSSIDRLSMILIFISWQGWFQDLSEKFLKARAAKFLVLAGTDRLDKTLMIGSMQG